jgi:uncharacterized protein
MVNLAPSVSSNSQTVATTVEMQPKKMIVSWNDYDEKVKLLAQKILDSGWQFNTILAVARGGLPVGTQLSHLLNKKLAVVFASSYHGAVEGQQGEIKLSEHIATLVNKLGPRVLIVDDLVDTGVTLQEVRKALWMSDIMDNELKETRIAVLFAKKGAVITPDYCVENNIEKDRWIYLPYEKMPNNT